MVRFLFLVVYIAKSVVGFAVSHFTQSAAMQGKRMQKLDWYLFDYVKKGYLFNSTQKVIKKSKKY
jgi:hypothetical protein